MYPHSISSVRHWVAPPWDVEVESLFEFGVKFGMEAFIMGVLSRAKLWILLVLHPHAYGARSHLTPMALPSRAYGTRSITVAGC